MPSALEPLGLKVPDVLLPRDPATLRRWPVIACDQYTSQPEYWERLAEAVGPAPSALHLVLPEVFLGEDEPERIAAVHARMREYVDGDVFGAPVQAGIVVDRRTPHTRSRKGLLLALDLERYDYRPGSTALARATERTVEERLPARVAARDGALLELPHVMVLIDDPERRVIEPLTDAVADREPRYDVELWGDAGRVRGWTAPEDALDRAARALATLAQPESYRRRYGVQEPDVLLYAVGDGNHSLGAAKLIWEKLRPALPAAARATHPARHALVELVNVHDDGLDFEPIHRLVFDRGPTALLERAADWFRQRSARLEVSELPDEAALRAALDQRWKQADAGQAIGVLGEGRHWLMAIQDAPSQLAVGSLQAFLDDLGNLHVDYIHGESALRELSAAAGRTGFWVPVMHKRELFPTVIRDGALPRKTFSMGEADEKRFYLEARRILP